MEGSGPGSVMALSCYRTAAHSSKLIMICMRHDDDNKSSLLWPLLDYDHCDPATTTIIVTSPSVSVQTSIGISRGQGSGCSGVRVGVANF